MKPSMLMRALLSIDMFREALSKKRKVHADDYFELAMLTDDYTFKAYDGSFISISKLSGYRSMVSNSERLTVTKRLEKSLSSNFTEKGYHLQIVDVSNPTLTKEKLKHSMTPSLEEMHRMGIGAPFLTEGYVDFLAKHSVWKEQYMVLITRPEAGGGEKASEEKKAASKKDQAILNEHITPTAHGQTVFLNTEEQDRSRIHRSYVNHVKSVFKKAGVLFEDVIAGDILVAAKQALYGAGMEKDWEPNLAASTPNKKGANIKAGEESMGLPPIAEQVVTQGYREDNLPVHMGMLGDRYFSTVSIVLPQRSSDDFQGYQALVRSLPKSLSYVSSQRIESEPFLSGEYRRSKWYTAMSSVLPGAHNKRIKAAHKELEKHHKNKTRLYVWCSFSITVFGKSQDEVSDGVRDVKTKINSWGGAQPKSVEMDKLQGVFDGIPGATTTSHQKQFLESLSGALYQSALFMEARPYKAGYLHFINTDGVPFPYEEQSEKNYNYNAYVCGESGTGKSTLLSILNMALLSKPKTDKRLFGQWPLLMNVDMGKTSFGMNDTLMRLLGEEGKHLVVNHEMTLGVKSAYNIHDLTLGRISPTDQQYGLIVRQMAVMLCGIDKSNHLKNEELVPMIKRMVKEVYAYYSPENEPKMYDPADDHKSLNPVFKKLGITPDESQSYFELTYEIMSKSKGKMAMAASYCQRFAVPLLEDYTLVLGNTPSLSAKYKEASLPNGESMLGFFTSRLGDLLSEYRCFNTPTKLEIDKARVISIDINNVCAGDEQRKAIFTGLCFAIYRLKSESVEMSPDLFDGVDEVFLPNLQRSSAINFALPSVCNVEEAHTFMTLFDHELCEFMRKNRKEGWGLRSFSQRITDPSDTFLSLCSSVYITSDENESVVDNPFTKRLGVSKQVQEAITNGISNDNTQIVVRIKTQTTTIAQQLSNFITAALLWSTTSTTQDVRFKNQVMDLLGDDAGMDKLSDFFPRGQVSKVIAKEIMLKKSKAEGFGSVVDYLLFELSNHTVPTEEFKELVNRASLSS
tara:strand:- start:3076 stop:6150 length:3075 start_codon:yes stop_codon:yes gene_type:complete